MDRVHRRPHRPPSLVVSLERQALVSVVTAFMHRLSALGLAEMALASILAPLVVSASRAKRYWCRLTDESGHALRGRAGGAFGPDLAKKLSQLVKMEKNVMRSLELVARERMEVAVCVFCSLFWSRSFSPRILLAHVFLATIVSLG